VSSTLMPMWVLVCLFFFCFVLFFKSYGGC
jgi:hypothetical protein